MSKTLPPKLKKKIEHAWDEMYDTETGGKSLFLDGCKFTCALLLPIIKADRAALENYGDTQLWDDVIDPDMDDWLTHDDRGESAREALKAHDELLGESDE